MERIDSVLAWDAKAVDKATKIKKELSEQGKLISNNDIAIAGHAISVKCILVTNNTKEFERINYLKIEDWTKETLD